MTDAGTALREGLLRDARLRASSALHRVQRLWDAAENPVLGREFRGRMRGARSYLITGGYTLVVTVIVLIAYAHAGGDPSSNQLAARTGRDIWTWGCFAQALLLPLLVPAFTCGAITLEREREMLDLLLLTRQSAAQICLGKLAGGVGLGLMLLLSSVPALALSLILGGVAPGEIACCLAVLVSTVVGAGAVGLYLSSIAPKTFTASTFAYLLIGCGLFGLPVVTAMMGSASSLNTSDGGILLMLGVILLAAFPPAVGAASGIMAVLRARGKEPTRSTWFLIAGLTWAGLLFIYLIGLGQFILRSGVLLTLHPVMGVISVMDADSVRSGFVQSGSWLLCTVVYLSTSVACFYFAVRRVRRMRAS